MGPLTLRRPLLFVGLILGSFITAGIGFWFVFHPPHSQNLSTSKSNGPSPPAITPTKPASPPPAPSTPRRQIPKINREPKAKSSETKSIAPPGSLVQENSGGINVQQGTTGADSPIVDSPITIGNLPKAIPPQDVTQLTSFFLNAKVKSRIKIFADQTSGAQPLPDDFYDLLKAGEWTMVDSGVNHVVSIPGPGRLFRGAELTVNGEPLEKGQMAHFDDSDPVFYIGSVLKSLKIPTAVRREKAQPEGLITITFENGFP